uniref:Late embryogenesis abundant protein LEA-2 subgroup domain-containing protein n=1 Tax=Setaria viridis TaxID=4556 RepID=A0A4U6VXG6_SETVI|nr:hypothetical protein SEVIR_2G288600v2 [Setaria viridis]
MGVAKDVLYCCCALLTVAFIGWIVVAVKYACVVPFRASVDEASLARLALTAPGGNGTLPAASLAYDLALVVSLRRNSRAVVGVLSRAAPLDAELRFLGRPFARARLAGAGCGPAIRYLGKTMVYRLAWKGESATPAPRPNEVAAFARESAAGVFELQLVVAGEFKCTVRSRWYRIRVSCALRLSVSTAAAPAPIARVECAS